MGVIAQDAAVADAESAARVDDDAPRFERLGGRVDGIPSVRDAEVGAALVQRFQQPIDSRSRSRFVVDGFIDAANTAVGSTL